MGWADFEKKDVAGIIMIACGVVLLAGVTALAYRLQPPKRGDDLCILGAPLPGHTVVVIDRTEPWSQVQIESLTKRINAIRLEPDERLSVYSIDGPGEGILNFVFTACNPGKASDYSALIRRLPEIDERFKTRFLQPFNESLHGLKLSRGAQSSPILEALQEVLRLENFGTEVPRRALWVFSDMLEHVPPDYSQYSSKALLWREFRKSDYFRQFELDFTGISGRVVYLRREKYRRYQTKVHQQLWADLFSDLGGRRIEIRPVRMTSLGKGL